MHNLQPTAELNETSILPQDAWAFPLHGEVSL